MVNPVGKAAVFAGAAAVGAHVAWGEYKQERERRAADAERHHEKATHDSFVEEMRRAEATTRNSRQKGNARTGGRSAEDRRAIADLTDLRMSPMGRALGKLRRALERDFSRSPTPVSAAGLPLIGRADTVDFVGCWRGATRSCCSTSGPGGARKRTGTGKGLTWWRRTGWGSARSSALPTRSPWCGAGWRRWRSAGPESRR